MRRSREALLIASTALLTACGSGDQEAEPPSSAAVAASTCGELASLAIASTSIAAAEVVAAGAFRPPEAAFPGFPVDYARLPSFCRVTGSIKPTADSDIGFEVWLPEEGWNGKFMQTGNGGAAGVIIHGSLADGLGRGYAVANTDTGHRGGAGDFSWALGHPEKLTDFAYRAVHELTIAAKAITTARYGREPARSYWNGCSTGGRQGLKEAQRYPDDYDAIIAGAPANNWLLLMGSSVAIQRGLTGADGLGVDKLGALKEAAIAACDADDGVTDRVIAEPATCAFDPASLQCADGAAGSCLSAAEVAAAKRLYAGLVDDGGNELFPGTGPGSEPLWGAYASEQFAIGTNYFRNVVFGDPSWDPASFDADADVARAEAQDDGATKAMDPNLSAFVANEGRLLLYHGTTDGLIPHANTVSYYESVVATLGADAAEEHVAFFSVPGMDHCAGGEGAFAVDWLGALEQWDETGRKPTTLPASHPAIPMGPPGSPPSKPFTRPVCAYPQAAMYDGDGDDADAANWTCVAP